MSGEDNEFAHGVILFEEPSELLTTMEHMGFLLETTNVNKGVDEKIAVSFIRWDKPEDTMCADLLAYVQARSRNPVVRRMLTEVIAVEGGKYKPKTMDVPVPVRKEGWEAGEDMHIRLEDRIDKPRSQEEIKKLLSQITEAAQKQGFDLKSWTDSTGLKQQIAQEIGYHFQNYLELVDHVETTEGQ